MSILIAFTTALAIEWSVINDTPELKIELNNNSIEIFNGYTVAMVKHHVKHNDPVTLYYAVINEQCATSPEIVILDGDGNVVALKMYHKKSFTGKAGDILCEKYESISD